MRKLTFVIAAAVLLVIGIPTSAAEVLTNADIVELVAAGLSDTLVITTITNADTNFDTGVQAILALTREGVSSEVIEAMVSASSVTGVRVARVYISDSHPEDILELKLDGTFYNRVNIGAASRALSGTYEIDGKTLTIVTSAGEAARATIRNDGSLSDDFGRTWVEKDASSFEDRSPDRPDRYVKLGFGVRLVTNEGTETVYADQGGIAKRGRLKRSIGGNALANTVVVLQNREASTRVKSGEFHFDVAYYGGLNPLDTIVLVEAVQKKNVREFMLGKTGITSIKLGIPDKIRRDIIIDPIPGFPNEFRVRPKGRLEAGTQFVLVVGRSYYGFSVTAK